MTCQRATLSLPELTEALFKFVGFGDSPYYFKLPNNSAELPTGSCDTTGPPESREEGRLTASGRLPVALDHANFKLDYESNRPFQWLRVGIRLSLVLHLQLDSELHGSAIGAVTGMHCGCVSASSTSIAVSPSCRWANSSSSGRPIEKKYAGRCQWMAADCQSQCLWLRPVACHASGNFKLNGTRYFKL